MCVAFDYCLGNTWLSKNYVLFIYSFLLYVHVNNDLEWIKVDEKGYLIDVKKAIKAELNVALSKVLFFIFLL